MFRHLFARWSLWLGRVLLGFVLCSAFIVVLLRWVPPPGSMLMLERQLEAWIHGETLTLERRWQPWDTLPDSLKIAVIAAEDQRFAEHSGFDWDAIQAAMTHNAKGGSVRGASTLSQQVAKNLFLWSGRSWVRKGLEAWFTVLLETFWPKQRILEVYLNSAEWGRGLFGADAAARGHFTKEARDISRQEASLLAAVLPNPLQQQAGKPSSYVRAKAGWIRRQMLQLGDEQYLKRL